MKAKECAAGACTGFLTKTALVNGDKRTYTLYVPKDYTPKKEWPLIVFLHGMGERGDDGLLQTEVGIGTAIRRHVDRFPCLVLMPQCSEKGWWDDSRGDIEVSLADVREQYRIDDSRIYLTGLSMGGFATWTYGAQNTDLYAAMMPICGGGNVEDAEKLAKIPIWAFHGADDGVVPPQKSREMVEAVKAAGGNIKYTEYPGIDHSSWDPAYDDPESIEWLLKQRKQK